MWSLLGAHPAPSQPLVHTMAGAVQLLQQARGPVPTKRGEYQRSYMRIIYLATSGRHSFLAFLLFFYHRFFLFLPFFDFDLDIVCFILSFSCGYYAVSSVPVFAATRLAYNIYMYLDIHVRTLISPFYFCLRYAICFRYCVYYILLYLFPS